MKRTAFIAMIFLAACADSITGDQPATDKLAPADNTNLLSLPGMTLDLQRRQITLQAQVCLRQGLLELLVARTGAARDHESILHTEAMPSDIHAALLALGLAPGVPAHWVPLPDGDGQTVPPRGAELTITLHWTDADGQPRQCDAFDWLTQIRQDGSRTHDKRHWVFVGSQPLPDGAYWADATGEVVCVSNFPSTLIDVPFQSTSDNSMLLYQANTDAIPPLGTEIQVVLEPVIGAEKADYARATIEIDSNGDVLADGKILNLDELGDWAMDFIAVHRYGEVVIRTDPRALSHRIAQARLELRIGGVYQVHELRMDMVGELLPRTTRQMQENLDQLQYDLGHTEELFENPFLKAEMLLEQIEQERQDLQRLDKLWQQYEQEIRRALTAHERPEQPPEEDETPAQE